ncbi:MAG: hypothetical protein IPP90_00405 [Gemmatimonadaceae bacterium]|nr:hypothetical protein [Gemmatimonadaceae bacterium]
MRCVLLLSLALLPACASSSGGSASAPSSRPATQTMGSADVGSLTVSATSTADVTHLPNTVDAVWRILPSVFDSVGIPVTTIDQARKSIGNAGYKTRARLGKAPLSRYLDCGNTQIGPNADSYDVFMSVITTVSPEGASGAMLTTIVDAQSRPVTYNQAYSRCSSKGGIEIRIADLVKARLAR